MSIKPIIFSAPMVRALLAGTKTQTRRLVSKPEHYGCPTGDCPHSFQAECNKAMAGLVNEIARFKAGDKAYVRETVRAIERDSGLDQFQYRATLDWEDDDAMNVPNDPEAGGWGNLSVYGRGKRGRKNFAERGQGLTFAGPWVPAIHAPRATSRLWLTITNVRVHQLTDISEADAIAEGIEPQDGGWKSYETYGDGTPHPHAVVPNRSPVTSYRELWNTLHREPGTVWDNNPWVVAYTFTVHEGNIDAA